MLLVMGCGWLYVKFGALPQVGALLYGVKPVIIAIVAQALWGLSKSAIKSPFLAILTLAVIAANFLGVHELLLLALAGIGAAFVRGGQKKAAAWMPLAAAPPAHAALAQSTTFAMPASVVSAGAVAVAVTPFGLGPLFLFFLKVGSVLFGSGYVLLAYLRADLVERWHWISEAQLLDAIAVGQITPGPVFTTATFIGFILGGVPASMVATVGIFLPAFVFVAISAPWISRLRASPVTGRLLDGINVASLALMAVVSYYLGADALRDIPSICLAVVSAVLLLSFRVNSAWLVLGGACAGLLLGRH
jgi:chromate transporter